MSIKDRIRELKAKTAEARALRNAPPSEEEQLKEAEQELADEEALARLVTEYGPVGKHLAVVITPLGRVVVKKPDQVTFRRYQDQATDRGGHASAAHNEQLIRACVVHPALPMLEVIIAEYPGQLVFISDAACLLASGKMHELSGK